MQSDHDNLQSMLTDMPAAAPMYRPTNFWQQALQPIVDDIERLGFSTFKSHPSAHGFYVPGYGRRRYRRRQGCVERMLALLPDRQADKLRWRLDGRTLAWSDARLVAATDSPAGLDIGQTSESAVGRGESVNIHGRRVTRSLLNYSRALTLLKSTVDTADLKTCIEIGGGYGTLGELLLTARSDGFYVNVDIPPVAAVSTYYLAEIFGRDAVLPYAESRTMEVLDLAELRDRYRAVVLCPWQLPRVSGTVDLFANLLSFQEMEPSVVAHYCALVEPLVGSHVLLRNSASGKQRATPGHLGVLEPVSTDFVIDQFAEFEELARDSFVHGDENYDRSFRSEVAVLSRRRR